MWSNAATSSRSSRRRLVVSARLESDRLVCEPRSERVQRRLDAADVGHDDDLRPGRHVAVELADDRRRPPVPAQDQRALGRGRGPACVRIAASSIGGGSLASRIVSSSSLIDDQLVARRAMSVSIGGLSSVSPSAGRSPISAESS